MQLTITVIGGNYRHSEQFWSQIEGMICAMAGYDGGRLTRIQRRDGTCNYRSHGDYDLVFRPDNGDGDVLVALILM